MKRILFALTMIAGLLLPQAQAATDVSLNLFYDNLSAQGNWIEVADYGYCFQPNVASGNANWRPYADGYWAYTDAGWTWVSYEDFGWATYHYGRWSRLSDYGWVWVPGYEWAPAWVSWRTGGDYVGWAPLPASANQVYEGRAITGQVDVEFDIGPQYYNFVDVRYIGEPVLRDRIFEPSRNVTIISSTVNVTNITYNNSIVYNYGPDYNRLNQYSTRPIQRLSLQRETTVGANLTAQGGGRNFNRVNGNQLVVVAPAIQKSQQQIAPKQVKAKVQQPKFEHGWQGVANRQQLQAEMKKENSRNVPPPTFKPQPNRKAEAAAGQDAGAQPNEAAPAGESNQQAEGAARQGQRNRQGQNIGAEADQRNEDANANAQADQSDKQARRRAGRGQQAQGDEQTRNNGRRGKARPAEQQQAERGQRDREEGPAQADQTNRRAEQQADREQQADAERKTPASEPDRSNAAQDEPRKARQEKKVEQSDTEKPDQPRARRGERAAQANEPEPAGQAAQPRHARPVQGGEQPAQRERSERASQAERPEQTEHAEQPGQAERAERASQSERPERAQPAQRQDRAKQQQAEQNPDTPRKGKKKAQPEETPTPPRP